MLHTMFTATVYKVYMLYLAEERLVTKLFLITYKYPANSLKLSCCWEIFYKISFYIEILTNGSCNDLFVLTELKSEKNTNKQQGRG